MAFEFQEQLNFDTFLLQLTEFEKKTGLIKKFISQQNLKINF